MADMGIVESSAPSGSDDGAVTTTAARASMSLLPVEVMRQLLRLFVGVELVALAQVNHFLRTVLNTNPDITCWQQRLGAAAMPPAFEGEPIAERLGVAGVAKVAKMLYCKARSLRFPGLAQATTTPRRSQHRTSKRGAHVKIPRDIVAMTRCRSFELWFSLLPGDADVCAGGVLVGMQAPSKLGVKWTKNRSKTHRAVVYVDTERNLYCSLAATHTAVVRDLEFHRWYHLALTFDLRQQRVFLDGALVDLLYDHAYPYWARTEDVQLGTGYMSADDLGKPSEHFTGWYGFHGLIDSFQTWTSMLSTDDVTQLARGGKAKRAPFFSLRDDLSLAGNGEKKTDRVRCSRPLERVVCLAPDC